MSALGCDDPASDLDATDDEADDAGFGGDDGKEAPLKADNVDNTGTGAAASVSELVVVSELLTCCPERVGSIDASTRGGSETKA